MRGDSLSDFDQMYERLDAWGFQGRADSNKPDPEAGTAGIYEMGRADRDGEGDELERAPDDPPRLMLTEREWETVDGYVRQLPEAHRKHVKGNFYKRFGVYARDDEVGRRYREYVDAAVRAVCDMEEANQLVNRRMRR